MVLASSNLALKVKNNSLQVLAALDLTLLLSEESESLFVASVDISLRGSIVSLLSRTLILEHG